MDKIKCHNLQKAIGGETLYYLLESEKEEIHLFSLHKGQRMVGILLKMYEVMLR